LTDSRWIVDVIVVRGAKGFASCSDEISEIADPVLLADLVIRASANKHHRAPISASFRRVPGCRRVPDPSSFVNDLLIETREDRSLGEIVKHAKRFKLRSKALDEIYRKDVLEEIEAALNDQPIEEALTGPERERELLVDHVRRGLAALAALDKLRQGEETTHEEGWAAIRGLQHEVRRSGRPPDYEGLLRQILSRHADKKMLDMYLNANDTMEQLARSYAKFNGWTILERRVVK